MTQKKILSLIMSITMLIGILPVNVSAAVNPKTLRTVYLHAQGENPPEIPTNTSTVYMGENADIYFAVDNPNKGTYLDTTDEKVVKAADKARAEAQKKVEENPSLGESYIEREVAKAVEVARHDEPQYDMNGYTLRICYDSDYFRLADTDTNNPIEYEVPDFNFETSDKDDVEVGEDNVVDGAPSNKEEIYVPQTVGYFVYKHNSGDYKLGDKTYRTAYITVFYSGGFVPQKKDDQFWYNLAKLSLIPKKTGSTDLFIDINSGDENYMLELFAKNEKSDEISDQYFNFNAVNGGYHNIVIKDKMLPSPPMANPTSGTYTNSVTVELTQDENLPIYYTTDGSDPSIYGQPYTGPITLIADTEIRTCARREDKNGDTVSYKYSNTVSYEYEIVPERPYLFDEDKVQIPVHYPPSYQPKYTNYKVYVSDKDVYGTIDDANEVYYTFSNADAENPVIGTDPETEWVRVEKQTPYIEIDKNRTVRLITGKMGKYSEATVYYLSITPDMPVANYESGEYTTKIDVTLSCKTEGATIYYTLDGTDPKTSETRIEYRDIPITLATDTTLRAVSRYDSVWSIKNSYYYLFSFYDDYGVSAFYPPGVYEGSVNVTLTPNNPDYVVWYHTGDGIFKPYDQIIPIETDTDIIAKAVELNPDGSIKSQGDEYTFTYKIKPLPPVFAPESTQFTNADKITIFTPESTTENNVTEHFDLYYTIDGTDPITSSTRIHADEKTDSAVITIKEYTVVSAVVLKDKTSYSSVVTHSYDIVTKKPVKPLTTLLPGDYTHKIGGEPYKTQFMPVPQGTQIYYTVSYEGDLCPDPVPGTEGTYLYNGTDFIDIEGNTVIKAVAVNIFGVKSDIGIFAYTITPEAPVAAPSATISGTRLPVVPVDAVEGSTVKYKIGDFENDFINTGDERFYIDTQTGNAYRDEACTVPLGKSSNIENSGSAVVEISSVLHGIESDMTIRRYTCSGGDNVLAPPYADKETGIYEERKIDEHNNLLNIKFYSLNSGGVIQYRLDNTGDWIPYTTEDGYSINKDTIIQLRYAKSTNDGSAMIYSSVVSYVYNFVPLAPIITLPSGTYLASENKSTTIEYDPEAPDDKTDRENGCYEIWYRSNGSTDDRRYNWSERTITGTMSFKAYVKNTNTGRVSKNTIHYYIIESGDTSSGSVYTTYPYDTTRISAALLSTGEYAKGMKLLSNNKDADIHYYYTYTQLSDGKEIRVSEAVYDITRPIMPTALMDNITVYAWLEDENGKIEDSDATFKIDFIHLDIPKTSLYIADPDKIEYTAGTKYTLINDYEEDSHIILYYTLDGSDPTNANNENRIAYNGEELAINKAVTVKTAYYSACGRCVQCDAGDIKGCWYGVYGETGTYKYIVPSVVTVGGGGGGGGRVVDKTRKYTVDIFGNEHPTHIGYINGYPDGSVQPEGDITREEITAILYRIVNHDYEEPFVITGDAFPDVEAERWSSYDIEYMSDKNIVYGYPDGEFKPARSLTRAEFAALIFRFADIEEADEENPFTDLEDEHWAYSEIISLVESGLVEGYEDGTFRPEDNISRAEVMTVINKLLGRKPLESYVKSLDFNPYNDLYENKWYYVTVLEATITHNYWLNDTGYEYKWEDWK